MSETFQKGTTEFYTRKQFIRDSVTTYIKNNPEEYNAFLKQVRERRAKLIDPQFGQLQGKAGKVDDDSFRLAFSLPSKLYNCFDTILNPQAGEPRFGDVKGEMAWFAKEFPEFLIPNKY